MATSIQQTQWDKCLEICDLCNLTPQDFDNYLANKKGHTLECIHTLLAFEDSNRYQFAVEECEEDTQTTSMSSWAECGVSDTVDNEQIFETVSLAESDTSSVEEFEDDAWSVVSEGESVVMPVNQLRSSDYHDQTDGERDIEDDDNSNDDADEERYVNDDSDNDADEEESEDEEEDLSDGTDKKDEHLDSDNEQDEQFDDCTEEGIRIAEAQKQVEACQQQAREVRKSYLEELEELKRQHQDERKQAAWKHDQMLVCAADAWEQLEIDREEAWTIECELKEKHSEELDAMQRNHDQQVVMVKLEFDLERTQLRKSLIMSQSGRCSDADNHTKLCADVAETLSLEIKNAVKMKAAFEKTLEVTNADHNLYVAELREHWHLLKSKLDEAQVKEQDDHEQHLNTRNQLARAQHEVQDLRQKEQDIEELQEQHEQQLYRVRLSYEQELDKVQREYEQEKAHNEEYVCELETEMDEMCQEKDELYHAKSQLCEKIEEQYQDLEFSHEHEVDKAKEEMDQLKQSLRTTSNELKDAKAELTEVDKVMVEVEETLHELCQQAQDSKVRHEQDMTEATGRRQELEEKICKLVYEMNVARLESMKLGDQLKEVKNELQETQEMEQKMKEREQEMKEREQELMSQCAADRLMFERTMQALRAMRQV
jgi:hypothetical protein